MVELKKGVRYQVKYKTSSALTSPTETFEATYDRSDLISDENGRGDEKLYFVEPTRSVLQSRLDDATSLGPADVKPAAAGRRRKTGKKGKKARKTRRKH